MEPYRDNVFIRLDPPATATASGLVLVPSRPGAKEHRTATVLKSGPGYKRPCCGVFIPNETKPGDRVIVEAMAGDRLDYSLDISEPRRNKIPDFESMDGERGEYRVVRDSEVLAILESADQAAE